MERWRQLEGEFRLMSKQVINIGGSVNDPTADTVRNAFDKVNDNFTELYNELTSDGSTLSSLAFSGDALISDATNGDINFTPNGSGVIYANADFNVNKIKSNDSAFVTVDDGLLVTGSFTFDGGVSVNTILDEDTLSSNSDTALATQQSIKAYVDSQIGGTNTLTIGDSGSNEITLNLDDTLNVVGTQNLTASVAGDTLTITGPDLSSYLTSASITVVGDDSTGTVFENYSTLKIAGTQNISTAVSGPTLTITGPDLSSYLTSASITVVGDDSTGTTVNAATGETFKIAGGTGITTAVSGDVLTVTNSSMGSIVISESSISSSDSTLITLNDNVLVDGDLSVTGIFQNVSAEGDFTIQVTDSGSGENPNLFLYRDSTSPADNDELGALTLQGKNSASERIDYAEIKAHALDVTDGTEDGQLTFNVIVNGTQSTQMTINDTSVEFAAMRVRQNIIEGTRSNEDIVITPSGAGDVIVSSDLSVNAIKSNDSTAIQINDSVNISGTLSVNTVDTNLIQSEDSSAIQMVDDVNVNGNLSVGDNFFTNSIQSSDSTQILINDSIQVDGNISNTSDIINQGAIFTDTISSYASNQDLDLSANGTGQVISNSPFKFNAGYIEAINSLTSSSTITVDFSVASVHTVTLAENTEFVVTNLPTGGTGTIIITQDGGGSNLGTFGTDGSTAVKFAGGTPTLSTAGGAIDVVTVFNDGVNYLGNIAKAYA